VVLSVHFCNALVGLSTIRVDLQVEAWRCSFGSVKPSGVVFISDLAMQVFVKDAGVFRYALLLLFGLWYPGSAPDLLKSTRSKGLGAFAALKFCSLHIGLLGSKGLFMLLYFVSGVVGS